MGRFVNPDNSAFQVALNSEIYPGVLPTEVTRLPDALSRIKDKTGQKFIVIVEKL